MYQIKNISKEQCKLTYGPFLIQHAPTLQNYAFYLGKVLIHSNTKFTMGIQNHVKIFLELHFND
jgi:hypothetical protein